MFKQLFIFIALAIFCLSLKTDNIPKSTLYKKVAKKLTPTLKKEFKSNGFKWGEELYFRVFKKRKNLRFGLKKEINFHYSKRMMFVIFLVDWGLKQNKETGKAQKDFTL